jgi:hypothetical protein
MLEGIYKALFGFATLLPCWLLDCLQDMLVLVLEYRLSNSSPPNPAASDQSDSKIWRFVGLSKFISLLSTRALYFARPSQFHDPYEGWMPRSHVNAIAELNQRYVDGINAARAQFHSLYPDADHAQFDQATDAILERYADQAKNSIASSCARFGISCWHKNEYESEAMWRAYPPESIAIESTARQLKAAYRGEGLLLVENVRYADFDSDPIEKGHEQYMLVMKRKSFEHEREVRAIRLLGEGTDGALLPYDLNTLINRVVVSPRADTAFGEAVRSVVEGGLWLDKPMSISSLYSKPDYGMELDLRSRRGEV